MQPVAYRTFCRYWQLQLGCIVIGKLRSDLCWTCQQNSQAMMKMANMADIDKEKVKYILKKYKTPKICLSHN